MDNAAAPGLAGEHGLALWIEAHGRRVIFDTGQSAACVENAQTLHVPLTTADALVLSHGHYDHTGGVARVLACAPQVPVYAHPSVTQPRFSMHAGVAKDLRMPASARRAIAGLSPAQFHAVTAPLMLADGLGLTGPIPRTTTFEDVGGPFFLDAAGTQPDMIEDDLALWIATPVGVVVCCGCCHAGLINTLQYICRVTHTTRIAAIIGGLHLVNANNERLAATMAALQTYNPAAIVPLHCTGAAAVAALQAARPGRVTPGYAGFQYDTNMATNNNATKEQRCPRMSMSVTIVDTGSKRNNPCTPSP
jgi:7,8-dihydropterin-6-yl-methyl-4-(beta-D-ribofuranosyl)aminobenzene 5'-phosphate synthase